MTQAIRQQKHQAAQPATRRWHNHLPPWILQDPHYATLRSPIRRTLQVIADRCNPPSDDGSLIGAFGGLDLVQEAGCSMGTFWRHLRRLESLGYVVVLLRGGTIGSRTYGNQYGVPSCRGGLDSRRYRRRMVRMVADDDGVYRPDVVLPGDQVEMRFSPALEKQPPPIVTPCQNDTGVVSKRHGGSVKMTRAPCQNETPPSWFIPHESKNHDHGASTKPARRGATATSRLRHIRIEDLKSTARLWEVFTDAIKRGLFPLGSEYDFLLLVGAAEHALRIGDNPCGLFASIVNQGRWLFITEADDATAAKRIKQYQEEQL